MTALEHVGEIIDPWSELTVPKELGDVGDCLEGWPVDSPLEDSPHTLTTDQVLAGKARELDQVEWRLSRWRLARKQNIASVSRLVEIQMRHDRDKQPSARARFVARDSAGATLATTSSHQLAVRSLRESRR